MATWIPFLEVRGPPIEAADRPAAERIARKRHGEQLARVQSSVSVRISAEERGTVARTRRLVDDDR